MPRFAIVIGEASGDQLGKGLIEALRARVPDAEFVGITGPAMRAAGCQSWGDYEQLALMGLVEVVGQLPRLRRLLHELRDRLRTEPPDVLIGIDAPDFNLRLARLAREAGVPTVQYVCPSVWAWRQSRVKTLRRACDLVLCLLPFEQAFLERHAVAAEFVGHPLADEIPAALDSQASRHALGLPDVPTVALLPGSRRAELEHLGPPFLEAVAWLLERRPELRFVVAAASSRLAEAFARLQREAALDDVIDIREGVTREVLGAADVVLLASGTATLETMLVGRPMVVAYKANPVTAWIARRLVKVQWAALPNLLANTELAPEFLQEEVRGPALGAAVLKQLDSPAEQARIRAHYVELAGVLRRNASQRAADAVLKLLGPQ